MEKEYSGKLKLAPFFLVAAIALFVFGVIRLATERRVAYIPVRGSKDEILALVRFLEEERGEEAYIFDTKSNVRREFDESKDASLVGQERYEVEMKAITHRGDTNSAVSFLCLAGMQFLLFLAYARKTVAFSADGIRFQSVLLSRTAKWDEIAWFDIWGKGHAVLGRRDGRSLSIVLAMFKQREEIIAELKNHLGEPTQRRMHWIWLVPKIALFATGYMIALHIGFVGYLSAIGLGIVMGICFLSAERRMNQEETMASILGLSALVFVVAVLVSGKVLGFSGGDSFLSVVAMFSGWFTGFDVARTREGRMRRIIGADWARPAC